MRPKQCQPQYDPMQRNLTANHAHAAAKLPKLKTKGANTSLTLESISLQCSQVYKKKKVPTLPSGPMSPFLSSLTHVNTAADTQYHFHAHKRDSLYTKSKNILCYCRYMAIMRILIFLT
jgi:hypothetical protein